MRKRAFSSFLLAAVCKTPRENTRLKYIARLNYRTGYRSFAGSAPISAVKSRRLFPGAYTTHQLVCRMALTSYDQIPDNLAEYCYVEFTMPATQVSHTTARSVSLQNSDSDAPPEKYVRNLSRHEYRYVFLFFETSRYVIINVTLRVKQKCFLINVP